jgi:hypothetical protein
MTVIVLLIGSKLNRFESVMAFVGALAIDFAYTFPVLTALYIK